MASEGFVEEDFDDEEEFEDELVEALEEEDAVEIEVENVPAVAKVVVENQVKFITKQGTYMNLYRGEYKTTPMLTKYERAKLLGLRATQIADGSPTFVDIGDLKDPIEIAKKELEAGKLPFIIRRPLPSKSIKAPKYEYRRVKDLLN